MTRSLRFDQFMRAAMYGPSGFYSKGNGAGTSRDFLTSPEVGSLFGAVVARRLDREWKRLGCPSVFTVVEVGAGPGTLARTVFAADPECSKSLRYVLVDAAEGMRLLHADHLPSGHVESVAELPTQPFAGVIFANELFDNIPCRLVRFDGRTGRWVERWVDPPTRTTSAAERDVDANDDMQALARQLVPHPTNGCEIPIQSEAAELSGAMLALLTAGAMIVIDYTRHDTAEFASRPRAEWMRTYHHHVRGINVLERAGHCDITVDVALDQLVAVVGPPQSLLSQAEALVTWGLDAVLETSDSKWVERSSDYDLHALRARSHRSEVAVLTDPVGLGGFTVLEWHR